MAKKRLISCSAKQLQIIRHCIGWICFIVFDDKWFLNNYDPCRSDNGIEYCIPLWLNIYVRILLVIFLYWSYSWYNKYYSRKNKRAFWVKQLELAALLFILILPLLLTDLKFRLILIEYADIVLPIMLFYVIRYIYHSTIGILQYEAIKKKKIETELKVLRSQINTNFLYNTLNTIYAYNMTDGLKADELILQLSDQLRYQLNSNKYTVVPLKEEIEILQQFIEMEKLRYRNAQIDVKIEGNVKGQLVPPMLLHSAVELSILLGTTTSGAKTFMSLSIEEDKIAFIAHDINRSGNTINYDRIEEIKQKINIMLNSIGEKANDFTLSANELRLIYTISSYSN